MYCSFTQHTIVSTFSEMVGLSLNQSESERVGVCVCVCCPCLNVRFVLLICIDGLWCCCFFSLYWTRRGSEERRKRKREVECVCVYVCVSENEFRRKTQKLFTATAAAAAVGRQAGSHSAPHSVRHIFRLTSVRLRQSYVQKCVHVFVTKRKMW